MLYKEAFMLEVNRYRNKYLFVQKESEQEIIVCSQEHEVLFSKKFPIPILRIKWINSLILIQTKGNIVLIDPMTNDIKYLPNVSDFIDKILYVSRKKFVICSTISNLIVKINLEGNNHILVGSHKNMFQLFINLESKVKQKIYKNLTRHKNIFNHQTRCKQYEDRFVIYMNNKLVLSDYGYIISRQALQNEDIFLISSFIKPSYIFLPSSKVEKETMYHTKFVHKYIDGIPLYDNEIESDNIIVFLHGGPCAHYLPMHDLFISQINKYNIRIILLNYFGSSGYSNFYEKGLYSRGGELDFKSIERVIEKLKGNIILFGESYGAYLGILMSFKSRVKLFKVIAINGFVDIEFQRQHSIANKIIDCYFGINNIDNRNPILFEKNSLKNDLILINSINDYHCPIFQMDDFVDRHYSEKIKYYRIDGSHELFSYHEKMNILEIIFKELFCIKK